MKVLIVHPGPAFSVADVADGWARAFRDLGAQTAIYNFDYRLEFFERAHVLLDDGTYNKACTTDELVAASALESVGNAVLKLWPDLVVFVSGFWVTMDLVDVIRARGIRTVLLATESPYEDDRTVQIAAHFDHVVLNDPTNAAKVARVNPNVHYAPHSYDPKIHYPAAPVPEFSSDVVMVGTGYPSRVAFLEQINWDGIDLALRGNWQTLEHSPLLRYMRQPEGNHCCDNSETVDWYRSTKIGLNLYRKEANAPELVEGWAMGPREVELAAAGTFFMSEPRGENLEVFPMVPKFSTPGECEELIRYYLDRPDLRARIALEAHSAIEGWTFQERARKLCALIFDKQL